CTTLAAVDLSFETADVFDYHMDNTSAWKRINVMFACEDNLTRKFIIDPLHIIQNTGQYRSARVAKPG
ncbi:MAG TPA: hypothetical protein O0X82_04390, partial [Methanocorpusculum sp.]|nr:hypothetical protein [Methanocorpusculum sp.]